MFKLLAIRTNWVESGKLESQKNWHHAKIHPWASRWTFQIMTRLQLIFFKINIQQRSTCKTPRNSKKYYLPLQQKWARRLDWKTKQKCKEVSKNTMWPLNFTFIQSYLFCFLTSLYPTNPVFYCLSHNILNKSTWCFFAVIKHSHDQILFHNEFTSVHYSN